MITVWLAPDVLEKLGDKSATLRTCENCLTHYVQSEAQKYGRVNKSTRVEQQICSIVREAIATLDPHMRDLLGVVCLQAGANSIAVEVRLSCNIYNLIAQNSGAQRLH